MKTIVLMKARENGLADWLVGALADRPWAAQATRLVVQVAVPAAEAPAYDAVAEIWSEGDLAAAIAADDDLSARAALDIRRSTEVIGKPGPGPAPKGVTPGLSQLSFIESLPDLAGRGRRHGSAWPISISPTSRAWPPACSAHPRMSPQSRPMSPNLSVLMQRCLRSSTFSRPEGASLWISSFPASARLSPVAVRE